MKTWILISILFLESISAQRILNPLSQTDIPADLPIPKITYTNQPTDGYIFASLPYWGVGNNYLAIYNNLGEPVFYRKTNSTCTDFKLNPNGLITYFDYSTNKFYALDYKMNVVDSFWTKNSWKTDEHDIKFLENGNVLLIGLDYKLVDMSTLVEGGNRNASIVVNVLQEIDKNKNVVFEWKAYENYKYTDTGKGVNLLDQAFVHTHINSIDVDKEGNLIISARNLDEITKVDRNTGRIIWRLGGKNNQFKFLNDSTRFTAQHSANILPNGNLILFDNGVYNNPFRSRAIEYKIDEIGKTLTTVWTYYNTFPIQSKFWGNAQRLENGNTFIAWGYSNIAATEVNSTGQKVFEMEFPKDVYSYRLFRFEINLQPSDVVQKREIFDKYYLAQNYPNPFNPTTIIQYELPIPGLVTIKLLDSIGREIKVLSSKQESAGSHNLILNGSEFASGVYFYQLQVGHIIKTKKLLLLK